MPLNKIQKEKIIEDLKEKIKKQKIMIFVGFTNLKVKDIFNLRKKLKEIESELKIAKKTLIKIAFKANKLNLENKKIANEIALIFGYKEEISPVKVIWKLSQENSNLKILGGFFENGFKESDEMIILAQLPSKEELLAKLTGSISAPILNLVNVLNVNIKGLINVLVKAKT